MSGIPADVDAIDATWLGEALRVRHPEVRVSEVEVVERHEGTNAHAHLAVDYEEPAGAPARLFCKLLPSDPRLRPLVAATGMGRREALFYEHLADRLPIRTPSVHCARHEPGGDGFVIVLEDLAASGCTVSDGSTGVDRDAAAVALEDLAALHGRWADPERRRAEAAFVEPPLHDPAYASGMLRYGLEHHRDRLGEAFSEVADLYLERADAMHALWQQGPTAVIHGDTHIGNLFFDGSRVGFLDWGISSTGSPLRDVSYFLTMALTPDERRAWEHELLAHYLGSAGAAEAGLADVGFEEAFEVHRIHAAYTVVASCQAVLFPEDAPPARQRFAEAFVGRARAAVEDLESAGAVRSALGLC